MKDANISKAADINAGIRQFQATPGAVLLDVRTSKEYAEGHIPGSKNIPLQEFNKILSAIPEKDTPLFVYCQSGARSRRAVSGLQRMDYTAVTNLGGIADYRGTIEK